MNITLTHTAIAPVEMNKFPVKCIRQINLVTLGALFAPYGLDVVLIPSDSPTPGTYWGEPEAGLLGATPHIRTDTPVHSALHEGAHFVCMDDLRRASLDTNAGGDALEECAVCYLSIVLAEYLPDFGQARMFADMDRWGYSFRLGSAKHWFFTDADEAKAWLVANDRLTITNLILPRESEHLREEQ